MTLCSWYFETFGSDHCVILPRAWLDFLRGEIRLSLGSSYDLPMIELIPESAFLDRVRVIDDSEEWATDNERRRAKRQFAEQCRWVVVDDQGRLALPNDWCDAAGLAPGNEIILAGRDRYAECWNVENFRLENQRSDEYWQPLNEELGLM